MIREPVWFEDLIPGALVVTDGATITESSILDFAMQWDPQPFHLDAEVAERSIYGGLIASGFQTMLTAFRLLHMQRIMNPSSQGSPGMEELRWLAPVRPGDTIRLEGEVLEARPSASRPTIGIVRWGYRVLNQRDEKVMDWRSSGFHLRRPDRPSGSGPDRPSGSGPD